MYEYLLTQICAAVQPLAFRNEIENDTKQANYVNFNAHVTNIVYNRMKGF